MASEESSRPANDLEAEARSLVSLYNDAAPSHAPALDWFGMHTHRDSGGESFVLEAPDYIDPDGLAALREYGRTIRYIEAYEYQNDIRVQIEVPVKGEVADGE